MPLLEIDNLGIAFDVDGVEARAIEGVNIGLEAGEVLGLVGESGSGKSLTALSVQRLLPAAARVVSGAIRFEGRDLLKLSDDEMRDIRGARIAQIFQDPLTSLNPVFTIGSQIGEMLKIHTGMVAADVRTKVVDALREVEIPEPERRIDQYPHELSGGMRQRVMIAMALICRPALLIADEPTTALDVTIQAQILRLLKRLQGERRMATLFITHDLGVISQFADRLAVMYAGKIVEQGPAREVLAHPSHPYTKALLLSIPAFNVDARRLPVIRGAVPPITRMPSGCHFRTRCDYEVEACAAMAPDFGVDVAPGHASACVRTTELHLHG
jgi:oligopeptide/dipeptide ABC transporter ATP-binding protein